MCVYGVLALILFAVAGFTLLVLRRARGGTSLAHSQLESFGYLGAGALALVAAAVLVLGLAGVSGGAPELLAMIGMFAFVLYQGVAYAVAGLIRRRS
jgi:hypothetical protein